MDFLVAVLLLGLAEVIILTAAFRAFDRSEARRAQAELSRVKAVQAHPGRFFAGDPALPAAERASLDALLLQLERHVRREQAAAESFLRNPTAESLHERPRSAMGRAN